MAIRVYKPTSSARRFMSVLTYEEITKKTPEKSLIEYLKKHFDYNEQTGEFSKIFKDYSTHKMKIFYMERGGGASNLHMRFNLASVKPGTVELSKELSGVDGSESPLAEFAYQIKYKKNGQEYLLKNAMQGTADQEDYVFYKNTDNPVKFEPSRKIGGVDYDNVFILEQTTVHVRERSKLVTKILVTVFRLRIQYFEQVYQSPADILRFILRNILTECISRSE